MNASYYRSNDSNEHVINNQSINKWFHMKESKIPHGFYHAWLYLLFMNLGNNISNNRLFCK